jgi:hypothetical protein
MKRINPKVLLSEVVFGLIHFLIFVPIDCILRYADRLPRKNWDKTFEQKKTENPRR